jgi:hypothetical protein
MNRVQYPELPENKRLIIAINMEFVKWNMIPEEVKIEIDNAVRNSDERGKVIFGEYFRIQTYYFAIVTNQN